MSLRDKVELWLARRQQFPPRWAHLCDEGDAGVSGDGVSGVGVRGVAAESTQEVVVLDCETSCFDRKKGELLSIAAVIVKGGEVLLSRSLELTINSTAMTDPDSVRVHHLRREDRLQGVAAAAAIEKLLDFIGPRPICGFYIDYDRAILNRYIKQLYGFRLPNRFIEVSELYARKKQRESPHLPLRLTFEALAADLDIPVIERHTAIGDVVSTALMYIKLKNFNG